MLTASHDIFDRTQIRRQKLRSLSMAHGKNPPYFLHDWTAQQIEDRLAFIRRSFEKIVRIGAFGDSNDLQTPHVTLDEITPQNITHFCQTSLELFPVANQYIDCVTSVLCLHTVNDLTGLLVQIKNALKPDGLFLGSMLGGETLFELRDCLMQAELDISGGVTPRIFPFADKQQMGGLLQRAGFSLPVVDSDILTVSYDNIFSLMHDLRRMGEGNAIAARAKHFTRRSVFMKAAELYQTKYADADGRIRASFEIIFLSGWAPHESQQKPLKPGSATARLSDILGSTENTL